MGLMGDWPQGPATSCVPPEVHQAGLFHMDPRGEQPRSVKGDSVVIPSPLAREVFWPFELILAPKAVTMLFLCFRLIGNEVYEGEITGKGRKSGEKRNKTTEDNG